MYMCVWMLYFFYCIDMIISVWNGTENDDYSSSHANVRIDKHVERVNICICNHMCRAMRIAVRRLHTLVNVFRHNRAHIICFSLVYS